MKILIVDDSNTMRRIINNTLERIGFDDNYHAEDGIEALKVLDIHPDVGLILTDWNMPNMNGLELVRRIRSNKFYDDVPIVMITTEGGKPEVITALKAGVNNYIVKPFTPAVFKEKLNSILG